jgi:hypothetical protein
MSSKVYMPTTHQVLLFEEAGDAMLNLNTSTYDASDYSTDLQAAINITDQFGLGIYVTEYKFSYYERTSFQEHSFRELFFVWNPFEKIGNEHHEFVFGIGMGMGEERDQQECFFGCGFDPDFVQASAEYNKLSAQYNLGIKKQWLESGVALKLSYLNAHTYNYKTHLVTENTSSKNAVFIEPTGFVRFGFNSIKLEIQTGIAAAASDPGLDYNSSYLSVGINIRPDVFFRKN